MRRHHPPLRLFPPCLVLCLGLSAPFDSAAWQAMRSDDGVPLRWYRGEIGYTPDAPGPSLPAGQGAAWEASMAAAFARWQGVLCGLCPSPRAVACPAVACPPNPLGLRFVPRQARPLDAPCRRVEPGGVACGLDGRDEGALVFVKAPEAWPFGRSLLAVTLVSHDVRGGAIEAASVLFNEAYHTFCLGPCAGPRVPLPSVLTHEIGHMLGLDHSEVSGATMATGRAASPTGPAGARGSAPAGVSEDDVAGVCHLYRVDHRAREAGRCQADAPAAGCLALPSRAGGGLPLLLLLLLCAALLGRCRRPPPVLALLAVLSWHGAAGAWTQATVKSGAHMRWYTAEISYSIDADALEAEGVGQQQMREVARASFAAWEQVQCGLCHDPAGVACEPVKCPAHPLGLGFVFEGFKDKLPPGPGCVGGGPSPVACPAPPETSSDCEAIPNGNQITVVRDPDRWCFGSHTIAMTLVSANEVSGEIADADILLNAAWKVFCAQGCGPSQWDLTNTLTHEIGHFIGLDHSEVPTSTMFGGAPAGETDKRSLEDDDVQGVCHTYRQAWQAEGCPPSGGGCCHAGRSPGGGPPLWSFAFLFALHLAALWSRARGGGDV